MDVHANHRHPELPDIMQSEQSQPKQDKWKGDPVVQTCFSGEGQILKNQRPMVFALDNYVTGSGR